MGPAPKNRNEAAVERGAPEKAFDAWFARTLRQRYETALTEAVPDWMLAIVREHKPLRDEAQQGEE